MIGLIISGHGNFASGMHSSLKLISGESSNVEFVDFEENDSIETLKEKYMVSLKNLKECSGILALCDLAGGSPFKTLVELKILIDKPMEVVGGSNLPMLIEMSMTKDFIENLNKLTNAAIETGKNGVCKYEYIVHEEIECEDGI